jgi:hypothetical protein
MSDTVSKVANTKFKTVTEKREVACYANHSKKEAVDDLLESAELITCGTKPNRFLPYCF